MKLDKKKKIVALLVTIVLIILGFLFFTRKSFEELVVDYIVNMGFKLNNENNLYEKRISKIDVNEYYDLVDSFNDVTYDVMYFNSNTFTLLEDKMEYSNGITYMFNGTYNYIKEKLSYVYEVSMGEVSIILEGDLNNDNISCNVVYSSDVNIKENGNVFCDNASYEVEDFKIMVRDLIDDPSLLEKMKNSK